MVIPHHLARILLSSNNSKAMNVLPRRAMEGPLHLVMGGPLHLATEDRLRRDCQRDGSSGLTTTADDGTTSIKQLALRSGRLLRHRQPCLPRQCRHQAMEGMGKPLDMADTRHSLAMGGIHHSPGTEAHHLNRDTADRLHNLGTEATLHSPDTELMRAVPLRQLREPELGTMPDSNTDRASPMGMSSLNSTANSHPSSTASPTDSSLNSSMDSSMNRDTAAKRRRKRRRAGTATCSSAWLVASRWVRWEALLLPMF